MDSIRAVDKWLLVTSEARKQVSITIATLPFTGREVWIGWVFKNHVCHVVRTTVDACISLCYCYFCRFTFFYVLLDVRVKAIATAQGGHLFVSNAAKQANTTIQ